MAFTLQKTDRTDRIPLHTIVEIESKKLVGSGKNTQVVAGKVRLDPNYRGVVKGNVISGEIEVHHRDKSSKILKYDPKSYKTGDECWLRPSDRLDVFGRGFYELVWY